MTLKAIIFHFLSFCVVNIQILIKIVTILWQLKIFSSTCQLTACELKINLNLTDLIWGRNWERRSLLRHLVHKMACHYFIQPRVVLNPEFILVIWVNVCFLFIRTLCAFLVYEKWQTFQYKAALQIFSWFYTLKFNTRLSGILKDSTNDMKLYPKTTLKF